MLNNHNNILIVNARFLTQELTGVQRFAIEIAKELKKKLHDGVIFVCPKNIIHHNIANELDVRIVGTLTGHLWEQLELPFYLKFNQSLLLNLANTAPIFYKNKIVTLHDIAYVRYPHSFSWKFRFFYKFLIPIILNNANHILTVSDFSRKEISDFYNVSLSKITVVYNAVASLFKPLKKVRKEKYILAVSSISPHKNFVTLINAFNRLNAKNIKLYVIGSVNYSFKRVNKSDLLFKNKNIEFKGRVTDEELVRLYSNAEFFVHPSLYEGFGIPPLEAQSCNCAVLCSNAASLSEVGGDSFLYFDPQDIQDLVNKMSFFLANNYEREIYINKGNSNLKRFSWKESANKIIASINKNNLI